MLLSLPLALAPGDALAQTDDTPIELSETNTFGMGARAMGMGTAFVGVADDASTLYFNPAGLTQLRGTDLTAGLSVDDRSVTTTHVGSADADLSRTRFEELAVAFALPYSPSRMAMGFAYRRWADLDQVLFKEGFLIQPTTAPSQGLFELEDYRREGSVDAWTGAVAFKLHPRISLGGSVSYLRGWSTQNLVHGNYRATVVGNDVVLDVGSPSNPDDRVFEELVYTDATAYGFTGSLGMLFEFDYGIRLGGNFDFPASLKWDGWTTYRLEDWQGYIPDPDPSPYAIRDDMTLPLSLSGGLSWKYYGLLLSGGLRWTDYSQIDFEGRILAPPQGTSFRRENAYRSVVGFNVGGEWTSPTRTPFSLRAGYYTKPLPYKLIAADPDFRFLPSPDDVSILNRDYPVADIVSDQHFFTLGAGVKLERVLSLDAAYQRGTWKRSTPSDYVNSTTYYPTTPTIEDVTQDRWFLTATAHFR